MTDKTQHTPGPWRIASVYSPADGRDIAEGPYIVDELGRNVAAAMISIPDDEFSANLRLIAAAPAMNDLLERIADTPCNHGPQEFCPRTEARAVLARARMGTLAD